MNHKMFCFQCQETAGCKGCTVSGVCGKKPEVAAMQDLLIYVTKGLSAVTTAMRAEGKDVSRDVNHRITMNLFTTITNANFDREAICHSVRETLDTKTDLLMQLENTSGLPEASFWNGEEAEFDAWLESVEEAARPRNAHEYVEAWKQFRGRYEEEPTFEEYGAPYDYQEF